MQSLPIGRPVTWHEVGRDVQAQVASSEAACEALPLKAATETQRTTLRGVTPKRGILCRGGKRVPAWDSRDWIPDPFDAFMEPGKGVDVWSQETYKSNYRLAYCHAIEDFPDRVQKANSARLLLKSAGDPGHKLHFGNWPAKGGESPCESPLSPGSPQSRSTSLPYSAKSLVKESIYRTDYRHGQSAELDPHLESFRPATGHASSNKTNDGVGGFCLALL